MEVAPTTSAIFKFLTGPGGHYDIRGLVYGSIIKEVVCLGIAGGLVVNNRAQRTLNSYDLFFRSASLAVSVTLLGAILKLKPSVFGYCFWAHMLCLPGDAILAVVYVAVKQEFPTLRRQFNASIDSHLV